MTVIVCLVHMRSTQILCLLPLLVDFNLATLRIMREIESVSETLFLFIKQSRIKNLVIEKDQVRVEE